MLGMPVTIREFNSDDFDTLWHIDQQCFPAGIAYSRRELAGFIALRGSMTLVAESESGSASSQIVGFIVAKVARKVLGHVVTIDVIAGERRSGVGSLLLSAVEKRLQQAGCRGMVLETAVDNRGALNFYKRHGYDVIKTVPRYYSNGVDAFVLQKTLVAVSDEPARGSSESRHSG
jgi:ribosomal-protein-alanine N-acetyltransferase